VVVLPALGHLCSHFGGLVAHAFLLCAAVPGNTLMQPPQAIVATNDFVVGAPPGRDVDAERTAARLVDVAREAFAAGKLESAADSLLQAIPLRVRALGDTHPAVALTLHDLARVRLAQGEPEKASLCMDTAMNIIEDQLGIEDPVAVDPMFTMAQTRLAQGNVAASVWWMNRILRVQEGNDEPFDVLGASSEVRKRAALSDRTMDTAVTLHVLHAPRDPEAARLAFSAVLRRKDRVFETRMQALSALRRLGSKGQTLSDDLQTAHSKLAKVIVQGPGNLPIDEYRARVSAIDSIRNDLEMQLGPQSMSGYLADPRPDVEVMQRALPEASALIEFMLYRPTLDVRSNNAPAPRYAAYVLRKSGGPVFVDLGEARSIDALASHLRRILSHPQRNPLPLAHVLGDRVMAPLMRLVGDAKRLLVAPDGELSLVPLGALRDDQGWYLDRFELTYLSTGRELIRAGIRRAPRQDPVIFAAPDFDHAAPTQLAPISTRGVRREAALGDVRFPPLGHAAAEAREIHAMMPRARVFLGAEATEVLVKRLQGPEILHLATHGFYLRNAPKNQQSTGAMPREVWEDGFLRGGLAFAGANLRESDQEDGVLTALEASSLDLEGTKLVVLSGCETGIGEVQARDGVRGLRHAFLTAGAQTLVTSLWPVDDEATQKLMVAYYAALEQGQGRSEALRTVARATMHDPETKHPYAWAGFIVVGDGSRFDGTWSPPSAVEFSSGFNGFAPPEVLRGPRGCACSTVDQQRALPDLGLWLLLGAAWLNARRRRGTRQLHKERRGVTRG
jgi:MYXO-CTERM domain-containing protein